MRYAYGAHKERNDIIVHDYAARVPDASNVNSYRQYSHLQKYTHSMYAYFCAGVHVDYLLHNYGRYNYISIVCNTMLLSVNTTYNVRIPRIFIMNVISVP